MARFILPILLIIGLIVAITPAGAKEESLKKSLKKMGESIGDAGKEIGKEASEAARTVGKEGKKAWYRGVEVSQPALELGALARRLPPPLLRTVNSAKVNEVLKFSDLGVTLSMGLSGGGVPAAFNAANTALCALIRPFP